MLQTYQYGSKYKFILFIFYCTVYAVVNKFTGEVKQMFNTIHEANLAIPYYKTVAMITGETGEIEVIENYAEG